jgi:hypothetical protein
MPHVFNLNGPTTSSAVITSATLNGAFGQVHHTMDGAAKRLKNAKDEFKLNGDGYDTKWHKFTNTTKTFAGASACVGVAAATGLMIGPDFITGRGNVRPEGEKSNWFDEGLLGNSAIYGTAVSTGLIELGGAALGGAGAVLLMPLKAGTKQSASEHFDNGANFGDAAAAKVSAHVIGGAAGLALDAVRLPSIIVKATSGAVFGALGGTVGLLAGGVRAMVNK